MTLPMHLMLTSNLVDLAEPEEPRIGTGNESNDLKCHTHACIYTQTLLIHTLHSLLFSFNAQILKFCYVNNKFENKILELLIY